MEWFLQVQNSEGEVILLNKHVGNYKKYSKFVENAVDEIIAQFPTAKRWEVRSEPFVSKAIL